MSSLNHQSAEAHHPRPLNAAAQDQLPQAECSAQAWDAMRYLLGEFSAAEADIYEERLAGDVDAAEGLARAVMLLESLRACERHPSGLLSDVPSASPVAATRVRQSRAARSVRSWLSVACAGLVLTASWYAYRGSGSNPLPQSLAISQIGGRSAVSDGERVSHAGPALESVLSVWVELNAIRSVDVAEESPFEIPTRNESQADVPDWMFAALLAQADHGDVSSELAPLMDDIQEESL